MASEKVGRKEKKFYNALRDIFVGAKITKALDVSVGDLFKK